jgi:hypothetical protein
VKPAVLKRQAAGRSIARWFVPASRTGLILRDLISRLATWPGVSRLVQRSLTVGGKL